ncbi:MAG: hypothetical protein ACI4JF_08700 [Oscillospiraceae bacterium]
MYDVCPLCGGKIVRGECKVCGYEPPEESDIAAPYDIDPSNDRFGTTEDKYIPFEELYPQRKADVKQEERQDNIPNIKVRPPKTPPAKQKQYTPPKKKNTPKKAKKKKSRQKDKLINSAFIMQIVGILLLSLLFDFSTYFIFSFLIIMPTCKQYKKTQSTTDLFRIFILCGMFFMGLIFLDIKNNI